MDEHNKRKGRKTATRRTFIEEEPKSSPSGKDMMDLFEEG